MFLRKWLPVILLGVLCGSYFGLQARPDQTDKKLSQIKLPSGFKIHLYADLSAIGKPRMMAFDDKGNLYVAMVSADSVIMLQDKNQDGIADTPVTIANKLNSPNSVAIQDETMFISNEDGVVKLTKTNDTWSKPETLLSKLPTGGHTLKTVKIGPDNHLYLNIGSSCNVCIEEDSQRATILRFTLQGQAAGHLVTVGRHAPSPIWVTGLRNSQGFAWHPITKAFYATNEGADNRSDTKNGSVNDNLPPEHLNQIEPGNFYGWPYCWVDPNHPQKMFQDPNFLGDPDVCLRATAPKMSFISHSTPIGISFLHQSHFPKEYQQDAIVALHGSWNRAEPSGYRLVRVKFENQQPVEVVSFADGWLNDDRVWGRPVDVIVGPDGALYVSDDKLKAIYRINYEPPSH